MSIFIYYLMTFIPLLFPDYISGSKTINQ